MTAGILSPGSQQCPMWVVKVRMFLYQEPTNSVKRTSKVTWNCGPHLMGPTMGRLGVIRVGVLPVRVDSENNL